MKSYLSIILIPDINYYVLCIIYSMTLCNFNYGKLQLEDKNNNNNNNNNIGDIKFCIWVIKSLSKILLIVLWNYDRCT